MGTILIQTMKNSIYMHQLYLKVKHMNGMFGEMIAFTKKMEAGGTLIGMKIHMMNGIDITLTSFKQRIAVW